jgi:hypothetical protein
METPDLGGAVNGVAFALLKGHRFEPCETMSVNASRLEGIRSAER